MLEERTIYWVECDECSDCTPDFDAENDALRWASENDWEVGERHPLPRTAAPIFPYAASADASRAIILPLHRICPPSR